MIWDEREIKILEQYHYEVETFPIKKLFAAGCEWFCGDPDPMNQSDRVFATKLVILTNYLRNSDFIKYELSTTPFHISIHLASNQGDLLIESSQPFDFKQNYRKKYTFDEAFEILLRRSLDWVWIDYDKNLTKIITEEFKKNPRWNDFRAFMIQRLAQEDRLA